MMKKHVLLSALLAVFLSLGTVCAQMPSPSTVTVYSDNRRYFVVHQPKISRITVYQRMGDDKDPKQLWSTFGSYRDLAISNDGEHLVGSIGNIIPTAYTEDMIVLTFMDRAKPVRHVRLKQLVKDYSKLVKTKKGQYVWGFFRGFDRYGHYQVETVDKKLYVFDMKTGSVVSSKQL